jgi:hypothetical protein
MATPMADNHMGKQVNVRLAINNCPCDACI